MSRTLGEELLTPTRVYAKDCLALAASTEVHAFAHITGGGLASNLARSLPSSCDAVLDRGSWTPAPIFDLIASLGGGVPQEDMDATFNMGVGMAAVVADAPAAVRALGDRGVTAWPLGEIVPGHGRARLI